MKLNKIKLSIATAVIALASWAFVAADDYFEISKNLEIFTSVYRELNLFYVDETKPGELMKTGIDAMLRSLDPYTVYYPESKIEDYRFMTTGQYGGIGAAVNIVDEEVTIIEPYEGFPAQESGLRAGDVIVAVDGKSTKGLGSEEVSTMLKGPAGTKTQVSIRRYGAEEPLSFEVERRDVQIPDIPYYGMLDDVTGYIHLRSFTQTASSEVKKAFTDLRDNRGMQQLVFDLRGNGGGLLREAVSIVNLFIPKGTEVVSTRGKLEEWNKRHVALNEPLAPNFPLVILIDQQSASASEIVSGALQDLDRAVVVGNNTFGKGLVQQTKDLNYNTKIKLTVAKYYIPSGRCIQKLDYSSRDDISGVSEIPDSLVKAFETRGGRVVFDGRGIAPDIEVEQEEMSNILAGLMRHHVIFHYATQFMYEHESIDDPEKFVLGERYDDFVNFALEREFEYDTQTEAVLARLKEIAELERYYERAEEAFASLEAQLLPDKKTDLKSFKKQIAFTLEEEIVTRFHYQQGAIRYALNNDPVVERALKVFGDEYNEILSGGASR